MPSFKGYRLIDGYPEFRYRLGPYEIRELIKASEDETGTVRSFAIHPFVPVTVSLTPDENAVVTSSAGAVEKDGNLQVDAEQSRSFEITILEKNPAPPTPLTTGAAQ